ncbi:MAG TPA: hypothetical protein P5084_09460 [Paludibacter sp.]|nr:hypothetical protein [Paludibacter sp.]
MLSKIIFSIAIGLVVCWIYLFTLFDNFIYIHLVAIVAIFGFIVSYFTKSKTRNQEEEVE